MDLEAVEAGKRRVHELEMKRLELSVATPGTPFFLQGWNLFRFFRNSGFFLSSPLSSPAIAVFQAIFPAQKHRHFFFGPNLPAFFSGSNLPTFCSDPILLAFFFGPEFADIFCPARNCRHISLREIAGIFSDPKLPAFFSTRNCGI